MRLSDQTVVNLLVRRASLYQPTLAFRAWEQERRRRHPKAGPTDLISSQLWTKQADDQDKPSFLPSIHDLENALPSTKYESWDEVVSGHQQFLELQPTIHGFYSSSEWKRAAYQHRTAKLSELDLAVDGVLRMVDEKLEGTPVHERKVLFALGNGTFRTGFNMASKHTTFLRRLLQKVRQSCCLVNSSSFNDILSANGNPLFLLWTDRVRLLDTRPVWSMNT